MRILRTRYRHTLLGSEENKELQSITVQLTFLTYSFLMRPNFQGLPWFEFGVLVEGELLIRFSLINDLENLL